jgi:hypothetical protein
VVPFPQSSKRVDFESFSAYPEEPLLSYGTQVPEPRIKSFIFLLMKSWELSIKNF